MGQESLRGQAEDRCAGILVLFAERLFLLWVENEYPHSERSAIAGRIACQAVCISSHAPISATATELLFDFSESGSSGAPFGVSFLVFANNDGFTDVLFLASQIGFPADGGVEGQLSLSVFGAPLDVVAQH